MEVRKEHAIVASVKDTIGEENVRPWEEASSD